MRFGSDTCLYRLPMKVRRARWDEATRFRGFFSSFRVTGSNTATGRVSRAARNARLMASLYFWVLMNGSSFSPGRSRSVWRKSFRK